MNSKKKILITGSTFPRWEGDTEPKFIFDYAKSMTEYFEVHVLVPMAVGAKEEEIMDGVIVHRFHYFPIHKWETLCYPGAIVSRIKEKKTRIFLVPFLLFNMWRILRLYSKKVDLVHSHWLIPQGIIQASIKSVPYIVTGHGTDVTSLNMWPLKGMKIKTLKNAKYITAVSRMIYNRIQDLYANEKTSVISMGCDTSNFSSNKRKENYFGQGDNKVILFVGRLVEIKGVNYLIEAVRNINGVVLCIAGIGDEENRLREQAKDMGNKVIFLGPKTHDELPEIYASADVFVAPSITTANGAQEGFGLVILEAMASGIPVVASKSGGITDIIEHGKNGLLCEEKNIEQLSCSIKRVLDDSELRNELIKNGTITSENNSYKNIGKKYCEIIKEYI